MPCEPRGPIPREQVLYKDRHLVALLLESVTRVVLRPAAVTAESCLATGAASAPLQTRSLRDPVPVEFTEAPVTAFSTRACALDVFAYRVGACHRLLYVARRFLQYEQLKAPTFVLGVYC